MQKIEWLTDAAKNKLNKAIKQITADYVDIDPTTEHRLEDDYVLDIYYNDIIIAVIDYLNYIKNVKSLKKQLQSVNKK